MTNNMQFINSISSVASQYDAFILDLWGVIHDGQHLYAGAKDCLERLRRENKKIVLLSNAPRRASVVAAALERMGIANELYDAVITSGEAAYQCLSNPQSEYFRPSGNKYIYVGLERDQRILEGLDYRETDRPQDANFILLSHPFYDNQPEAEWALLLKDCLAAKLPALCINPDTEVVRQTGERVYCAGVIASHYAAQGGEVIYFGKPHGVVYSIALRIFDGIDTAQILAVGDNLATDIEGAKRSSIKSTLVTGGVLKDSLGQPDTEAYRANCAALFAHSTTPDYVIPVFNW